MPVDTIWVHAESLEGKVRPGTLENLTKARELGSNVVAFYAGDDDPQAVATEVGKYGAKQLLAVDPQGALVGVPLAAALAVVCAGAAALGGSRSISHAT